MAMDMLEHENFNTQSSIATRGVSVITSILKTGNHELVKSFLIKRFEVDFSALANLLSDDAAGAGTNLYVLALFSSDRAAAIDTVSEMLLRPIDDRQGHQGIIWMRPYIINPALSDDADQIAHVGRSAQFKTSKSFRKGFRLDKDEAYSWAIFNPTGGSQDAVAAVWLRVRYWGVYVQ